MLTKLSHAIEREYEKPHPSRKAALTHFQELYHCEKRGKLWYVDFSIQKIKAPAPTGNADADSILEEIRTNEH